MPKGDWKLRLQRVIGLTGYQLRRIDPGVSIEDPYAVQKALLSPTTQVIFEVGAADGRDAEAYCDMFPTAQVYAFEPVAASFAKLIARAARQDRLHAIRSALGKAPGTATMHVAEWDDASSLLPPRDTGSTFDAYHRTKSTEEVPVTTLDVFAAERGVTQLDLLKIDAQGMELAILEGAVGLLERGAVGMIFTEAQFMPLYEGAARYDQIAGFLYFHGFRLHNLYGLHHNHRGELCWGDALFIRGEAATAQ